MFSGTFGGWIRDYLKALALGLVVGTAGVEAIYVLLARFPSSWWLPVGGAVRVRDRSDGEPGSDVLLPMFYKFRPLEHESLRSRLVALSTRAGVPVLGVYEWAIGEKTRRANAALVGTGRTRRIILSDTLLAAYSEEEIEVVMAHELGHHVHRDIRAALVVESVLVLAAFFCAASVLNLSWRTLGLTSPADIAGLPLLLLAGGGIMQAATPLVNGLSRRNERRADGYALAMTEQPAAFISAMKRLGAQNLAEENPSRAVLWLFHSHPPVASESRPRGNTYNVQRPSATLMFSVRTRCTLPLSHVETLSNDELPFHSAAPVVLRQVAVEAVGADLVGAEFERDALPGGRPFGDAVIVDREAVRDVAWQ